LNFIQDGTPVLVVIGVPASLCRSPFDLDGPGRLHVGFRVLESGKQLRRELGTIAGAERQGLFEQLPRVRVHPIILGCGHAAFNPSCSRICRVTDTIVRPPLEPFGLFASHRLLVETNEHRHG
jgi:hypothetical protein